MRLLKYFIIFIVLILLSISCSEINSPNEQDEKKLATIETTTNNSDLQSLYKSNMAFSTSSASGGGSGSGYHLQSPSDNSFAEETVTFRWDKFESGHDFQSYILNIGGNYHFVYNRSTPYKTITLNRNNSYDWTVTVLYWENGFDRWVSYEGEWTVKIRPEAPSLSGTVYQGSPKLTWNSVSGAVNYKVDKIYRRTLEVAYTTNTSYIDWSQFPVERSMHFTFPMYNVKAINSYGWESLTSMVVVYQKDENW